MASTDATALPVKNQAFRVTFPVYDKTGALVTGAAGLDSEVSKDGGTFADCTNEATEIATSSGIYYLDLTSTEMNADTVAIIVKTSTTDAKTTPIILYPQESGDIIVDAKKFGGTTVTGRDIGASVLLSSGTGTGQISLSSGAVTFGNTSIATVTNLTNLPSIPAGWLTAAGIAASALNGKGDWNVGKTGYSLSGTQTFSNTGTWTGNLSGSVGSVTGLTASDVGAIKTKTDFLPSATAGSTGGLPLLINTGGATPGVHVVKINDATCSAGGGTISFPAELASPTNITAGTITTVTNLTNAPSAGDFTAVMKTSLNAATPASVTGAVGSVTGNVGGNVVGSVGSVTGLTASDVGAIKAKTDFLPSFAAGASGGLLIAGSNAATTFDSLTVTNDFSVGNDLQITGTMGMNNLAVDNDFTVGGANILTSINTGVSNALATYDAPTKAEMDTAFSTLTTHGDSTWATATGFSTLQATDIVSGGAINTSGGAVSTVTTLTNLPAITTDWLTGTGVAASAVTKIQAGLSTYAGGDTSGVTTLLTRIPSILTISAGKVDVNDKTGFALTTDYDAAKTAASQTSVDAVKADTGAIKLTTDLLATGWTVVSDAIVFTEAALANAPTGGGTAPTVEEIDAELSANHGEGAWGATVSTGDNISVEITDTRAE